MVKRVTYTTVCFQWQTGSNKWWQIFSSKDSHQQDGDDVLLVSRRQWVFLFMVISRCCMSLWQQLLWWRRDVLAWQHCRYQGDDGCQRWPVLLSAINNNGDTAAHTRPLHTAQSYSHSLSHTRTQCCLISSLVSGQHERVRSTSS